jgi:hypothetical protein
MVYASLTEIKDPSIIEALGLNVSEPQDEDWRRWYKELAGVLWRYVPWVDYDVPRTVDLFRSHDTLLPKSFRGSSSDADATSKPPAEPSNESPAATSPGHD